MNPDLGLHCGGLVRVWIDTSDLWDPLVMIEYHRKGWASDGGNGLPGWTTHEDASATWTESERAWVARWRETHGLRFG